MNIFSMFKRKKEPEIAQDVEAAAMELVPVLQAYGYSLDGSYHQSNALLGNWSGDKFAGGFGPTYLYQMDYQTLRERSNMLFTDNLYARGLIRRLITNEINTGLHLEATPEISLLGRDEDWQHEWSDRVETLWGMWEKKAEYVDFYGRMNLMELQRLIRMHALVDGDVLNVLRYPRNSKLPKLQVINADKIVTPLEALKDLPEGQKIVEGVHIDANGRHIGFYVKKDNGKIERIPAFGARSGRRIAWMVYGTERRVNDVRGTPLLALILQSMRELDRYRDSSQRKALINSMLAMFIKQEDNNAFGSAPLTGGAVRKSKLTDSSSPEKANEQTLLGGIPGMILQRLPKGETPVAHSANGQGEEFTTFEEAVISAVAWACEMPPSILRLAFSSNFAASQAEINELKIYLNPIREMQAVNVNQPIYEEWLVAQVLEGRIEAPGFIDALRTGDIYTYEAWVNADWAGAIKVAADIVKQAKAYGDMLDRYWITHARAAREVTGMKFTKIMAQRKRENEIIQDTMGDLWKFQQEIKAPPEAENKNPDMEEGADVDT